MPRYERTMFGPDGLLIILRRAIMLNEVNHAVAIARLISHHRLLHYPGFCDFIGRILLEDKYPDGLSYIGALEREQRDNPLKKRTTQVINKQTMFVKLAKTAAKLKTNHCAFELAFTVMYENVYMHHYLQPYKEYATGAALSTMCVVEPDRKNYAIEDDSNKPLQYALLRTYVHDEIPLDAEKMINEAIEPDQLTFPQDHVLRNACLSTFKEKVQPKDFLHVEDENIEETELTATLKQWNQKGELKYEASLFKKRKREEDSKVEDLFNYLYPKSRNILFKQHMLKMLEEDGVKHYVGQRQTKQGRRGVVEQLRRLARYRMIRPTTLTIENVEYELHYNSFDHGSWMVQLMVAENTETQSPHAGKQFKIYYPKETVLNEVLLEEEIDIEAIRTRNTNHSVVQYWNFDVARVFQHVEVFDGISYTYRCEEYHGDVIRFKHSWLDNEQVALAFLQLLVYRYHKGLRTTLTSMRKVNNGGDDFTLYSVDNTVRPNNAPNRKHPDIWHQLLYFSEQRVRHHDNQGKTRRSYISQVIDKLQRYLQNKGWKLEKKVTSEGETTMEEVAYPFFKWLKDNYPLYVEEHGLWHKMMESLQTRYNGQGGRVDSNISTFTENGYIKSQFYSAVA